MRVAINAMQVRAAKSGVGRYIEGLLGALAAGAPGDHFTVYCTAQNRGNYALGAPNVETRVWGLPQSMRSLRLLNEYARLPGELRRGGFDVFLGPSNFLPVRKVLPSVLVIHDLSYYVQPERCPWLRRQYWYAMTARSVALADRIITDSENSRRDIARFFPGAEGRTVTVPLGVHPRFRRLEGPRRPGHAGVERLHAPDVLFVGTQVPRQKQSRGI